MAKRLSQAEKDARARSKVFTFHDGPKAGDSMWLVNPAPKFLRLAFPEWCNYEWDPDKKWYVYAGSEKPT